MVGPRLRALPGFLSVASFFIITITCLIVSPSKQTNSYVWTTFINESGWSNPVATFLTGLISPNFGLGGLDGPIHLSEDTFDPARTVPMSIIISIVMGCTSALVFVIAMLYCITDISGLIYTRTGLDNLELHTYHRAEDLQSPFIRDVVSGHSFNDNHKRLHGTFHRYGPVDSY